MGACSVVTHPSPLDFLDPLPPCAVIVKFNFLFSKCSSVLFVVLYVFSRIVRQVDVQKVVDVYSRFVESVRIKNNFCDSLYEQCGEETRAMYGILELRGKS